MGYMRSVAVGFILLAASTGANAAVITYTNSTSFFNALGSNPFFTETYEGLPVNSTIADGTTINGITYTTFPAGTDGRIDNLYNRIGNQSLALQRGADATAFFLSGDSMTVNFASFENAVGIFFNANPSPVGSLTISTSEGVAGSGAAYDFSTLYFVGLISDTPFSSATIGGGANASVFNLDNLTVAAIPEPVTLSVFGVGLAGAAALRRRKKKAA
jgi:hypothetical protein